MLSLHFPQLTLKSLTLSLHADSLNGTEMSGRQIRIDFAQPQAPRGELAHKCPQFLANNIAFFRSPFSPLTLPSCLLPLIIHP